MYICIVSLYIYIFIYILFHIVLFVFFIFLSSLLFVPMLSLAIYKHNSSLYMADTKMLRIVKKTVLLGQKERATHTLQKEWIQREEFWLFKRKKTHIFPRTSWAELSFKALFSLVFGVIFFFEILYIFLSDWTPQRRYFCSGITARLRKKQTNKSTLSLKWDLIAPFGFHLLLLCLVVVVPLCGDTVSLLLHQRRAMYDVLVGRK